MDLDLNLLETLDALLQEGSVSRAAKRVGLSTPAMSHALARLRTLAPGLVTWGLSATLANLDEACETLAPGGVIVRGAQDKQISIDTLLPPRIERFAWGGHIGLTMLPAVVQHIEGAASTLVFTNTRSQTEAWYHAMLQEIGRAHV